MKALAVVLVSALPLLAQSPGDFPELRPERAAALLASHLECPDRQFRITDVTSYEADQRVVKLLFSEGPLESVRAFFEWDFGDLSHWGAGRPYPGDWAFVGFLDGRARGPKTGSQAETRKAVSTMKELAHALHRFSIDFNVFPSGDFSSLERGFFLYYLGKRPDPIDPWGHRYLYRCEARAHYVLISAGPDGEIQTSAEEVSALLRDGPSGRLPIVIGSMVSDDLVVSSGVFLRTLEPVSIERPADPITRLPCQP